MPRPRRSLVVLSSSREPRDTFQSYQLGPNSYVVKPVDFEPFSDMIRTLVKYWLSFNQPFVSWHPDLRTVAGRILPNRPIATQDVA